MRKPLYSRRVGLLLSSEKARIRSGPIFSKIEVYSDKLIIKYPFFSKMIIPKGNITKIDTHPGSHNVLLKFVFHIRHTVPNIYPYIRVECLNKKELISSLGKAGYVID